MQNQGLSLKNVSFSFKKNEPLFFASVNAIFEAGKLHFVQGRNGSGKSTLFRIIHGDIWPTECINGTYQLHDDTYKIAKNTVPYTYKIHIKHVIQQVQAMLVEQMTVEQNIAFAHMQRHPFLKLFAAMKTSDSFLQEAGIALHQPVHTLSGGQKQLLAIIMSSHNAGQVLLLDEPTAALDDANALLVMEILQKLAVKRNLVVIMICHDTDTVKKYCSGKLVTIKKELDTVTRTILIE